jgi:uncharacterized protein
MLRPATTEQTADQVEQERRDRANVAGRLIGKVVSVNGARAVIACRSEAMQGSISDAWSIGRLISISLETTRVVAMVYHMGVKSQQWDDSASNQMLVEVELVGEVGELADGGTYFRRGISHYPWLGAVAHKIRSADLKAVFEHREKDAVVIGTLSQDESIPAQISVEDMLAKHFAVVGTTGVGKSSAVSILVRKSVENRPNLRVIVLDPHNEYGHAFHDCSIMLDSNSLDLPHWLFKFDELLNVLYSGRTAPDDESDILRELIPLAKQQYALNISSAVHASSPLLKRPMEGTSFTIDTPSPYRVIDLCGLIDEMMGKLEASHDRHRMRVVKSRLESLVKDERFRFMFGRPGGDELFEQSIGRLFRIPMEGKPIAIVQLAGIPTEVLNAVVSVLARMAFDVAAMSSKAFEVLVLCEEAHRYVPQDPKLGFAPTRQAISRIAKEGRKYGCYIGIISQRPGELDPTIMSQCSTVFAMRLANDRDQELIKSAISDSSASQIAFLSAIGNREAIAFGEGVSTPMRMKFLTQDQKYLPSSALQQPESVQPGRDNVISLRQIVGRLRGGPSAKPAESMNAPPQVVLPIAQPMQTPAQFGSQPVAPSSAPMFGQAASFAPYR